jgi:hypothetical protein
VDDWWGPLAALAGTWEGDEGVDVSYHNVEGQVAETPYVEKVELKPFGPVDNGRQCLYGLDYRMAAWRKGEEDQNPFHTEVGYWLWDAARSEIYRCVMVPRGTLVLAGGTAEADATTFTLRAELGSTTYGLLENPHLAANASTRRFEITVTVHPDGSWSYDEDTVVALSALGGAEVHHTDRNRLRRVG